MLERIEKETGVKVSPPEQILCLPCDQTRSGGFTPEAGAVILCQGNFWSKKHMEHTVTHELVHMYDTASLMLTGGTYGIMHAVR